MARLVIEKLIYKGDNYHYESPELKEGIFLVEGDNGTGKSTFSDLIYYGLGGNVSKFKRSSSEKHIEITSDANNHVELHIRINDKKYTLKRPIDSNDIAVYGVEEKVKAFSIFRSKTTKEVFSDWLLEQLGISGFTLHFSRYEGKINFSDLARLIYHDQAQDPGKIYKQPDNASFVTDSKTFRKAIFEVLVGQAFLQYYQALDKYKKLENQRSETKGAISVFAKTASKMGKAEDWNTIRIKEELGETESQLKKLNALRANLRNSHDVGETTSVLPDLRKELESSQIQITDLQNSLNSSYQELSNLQVLKKDLIVEVTHIRKIMFTHDQLNLFSPDTCPYCLNKVDRPHGKCICGTEVDESEYERFFYSSEEYLNILKSKQKNVDTVTDAIQSCEAEVNDIRQKLSQEEGLLEKAQSRMNKAISEKSSGKVDFTRLNEIDDKILELRSKEESLEKQLALEVARQEMEDSLAAIETQLTSSRALLDKLDAQSREQISGTIEKFNEKYNELMKETVENCRRARIDDSYQPIVNDGEYLELSALVPKRLMYYLTLLYLSLEVPEMNFPRFLLIDTPDTAGIDDPNLKKAIGEIPEVIGTDRRDKCQVILTTGKDMYPDSMKGNVFLTLSKEARLLKPVVKSK